MLQQSNTGIGTRVLNLLIDTVPVYIIAFIGHKVWTWYVAYYAFTPFKFGWFFAAAILLYYTLWEAITNRTPGKMFTHSKVVNLQGNRPAFYQFLLRSLIRLTIIDPFFIPFLNKPLHDYLSKTQVVEA
jgi:uncharacterized RDD family membrane protein YckC